MDRVIVYPGALPQDTDVLSTNKFNMVGEAYHNLAVLGSGTLVAGLGCIPTSPTASLQVIVNVGSIFEMDPTDQVAYGDLGTDANNIMKQGLLQSPVSLTITPPTTSGFSQVYLVEAILDDIDTGSLVLSYYNSANPSAPFSGPANAGTSNFTVRSCQCVIALKAGTPASSGTQITPSADPGFTPLYTITVVNGQTQITSGGIVQVSTAPFFPTLPSVPSHVQKGDWVWGTDTGAANAYVVTVPPFIQPLVAYQAGMAVKFKAVNANSGSSGSTINVNGLGTVGLKRAGGAALNSGDIVSGQVLEVVYDGANFQMVNYVGISAGSTTNNFSTLSIPYIADTSGVANAITAVYSPAITSGQQVAGLFISVKLANNISAATTINVNGLGAKNVTLGNLSALSSTNGFVAGEILLLVYDGTEYQIIASLGGGGGGGGATGPQGPQGVQGVPGPQGIQGPAGSPSNTPGAIGSYAIAVADSFPPSIFLVTGGGTSGYHGPASNALSISGANVWPGTWQIMSNVVASGAAINSTAFAAVNPGAGNVLLMQRIA